MKLTNVPLRIGIWFLALVELTVGVVATLTPRVFYDDVPWVSLAPPYSEHLMRDYGAMNLALGVVSFVAAITMEQLMVRAALAAYLVFAIPTCCFTSPTISATRRPRRSPKRQPSSWRRCFQLHYWHSPAGAPSLDQISHP